MFKTISHSVMQFLDNPVPLSGNLVLLELNKYSTRQFHHSCSLITCNNFLQLSVDWSISDVLSATLKVFECLDSWWHPNNRDFQKLIKGRTLRKLALAFTRFWICILHIFQSNFKNDFRHHGSKYSIGFYNFSHFEFHWNCFISSWTWTWLSYRLCQEMYENIVTLSKCSKFVYKVCCSLDLICGDKCIRYDRHSKCECGDTAFDKYDNKYCCIPRNETCKGQGMLCKLSNIE